MEGIKMGCVGEYLPEGTRRVRVMEDSFTNASEG